jgi:hypothetical protein
MAIKIESKKIKILTHREDTLSPKEKNDQYIIAVALKVSRNP